MNIQKELESKINVGMYFNDVEVDPKKVKAVLINEIVPLDPKEDFYGRDESDYSKTILMLFKEAGLEVNTTKELLKKGIYLTNAVKTPKRGTVVEKATIEESLPYLEKELSLFPNCIAVLLMGDVARKSYKWIKKKNKQDLVVPEGSTYKIRKQEYYDGSCRVFPSYIITGKNILIEKSKYQMVTEDLKNMLKMLK